MPCLPAGPTPLGTELRARTSGKGNRVAQMVCLHCTDCNSWGLERRVISWGSPRQVVSSNECHSMFPSRVLAAPSQELFSV
jgi:hypothetical protein